MLRTFVVPGDNYHQGKEGLKALMKEYKLKWIGLFTAPKWASDKVKVAAKFVRDMEKDITIESQFEVTGEGPEFDSICEYIVTQLAGAEKGEEDVGIRKKEIAWSLKVFEMVHKPNVELLKHYGAPDSYIQFKLKEYEEKRKKRVEELEKSGV